MTADRDPLAALTDSDHVNDWDSMEDVSADFADVRPRKDRQLNLRVDADLLETLRRVASTRGVGYHSFARDLIEEGLARDAYQPDGADSHVPPSRPFRMKEVMLVLLGAKGADGQENEAVVGVTRLQKLLFLAAQHLKPQVAARFEAYDYGPFEESVAPDLEFLASEGLVEMPRRESVRTPRPEDERMGQELLAWVRRPRASPEPEPMEAYRLTQLGLDWVRRFLASDGFGTPEAKAALLRECEGLKQRFDRAPLRELVDFVYAEYPEFTEHSRIRHQVAERSRRPETPRTR